MVSQSWLPKCIKSNRDPHFNSHFWDESMPLLDTLITLTALHPVTNGMAEVPNYTVE